MKRLIVIAGNIGTGKTSLTEQIGAKLGWVTAFESVADNPYLNQFYADMKRWAFHLQVFYLGHRTKQYLSMVALPQSVILDRSIYEDAYIFARALYQMGNLNERDYQSYRAVFDLIVNQLPVPDLLIYLKAPVDVLMERIYARGRGMERGITKEYLNLLESYYEDWLQTFDICPVLTLRTDDLDYVHQPKHLNIVVQRIQDRLAGREELLFNNNPSD